MLEAIILLLSEEPQLISQVWCTKGIMCRVGKPIMGDFSQESRNSKRFEIHIQENQGLF